jgi:Flp pilus assembly protein TadD
MTNLDELEELLRSGKDDEAYKQIKGDRGITAEILMNEGITFGTLGDYSISISYFELAEKIAEDDLTVGRARVNLAVSYNNRGTAYDEFKKHEKAIKDYSKAIELNLEYAVTYNNRGNAYYELKNHEKAIEDYNKAIELNPEYATAYYNRGNAYGKLKKHEKAIEDYNKAIELNLEYAAAYNNRGNAYGELKKHEEAIEDYNKAIELNPRDAKAYANRGMIRLISNEDLYKAIADFKCARDFFEGKDKAWMLGFKEWAEARNAMNMKNWAGSRERMNEAKEYFDKINDPLSHSLDAFIKFSYLDEELDQALSISDPMEASEKIETTLKNLPEVEGLIDPERKIFNARISSFALVSRFIISMRRIDDNTDLGKVKDELAKLHKESKEVEKLFESVNFDAGKTTIVNMQRIISSVKQEIEEIKWAANRKQKALDILIKYWSRVRESVQALNGILTRKTEDIALERGIETMRSEMFDQFAETKEIITEGFKRSGEEHKEILDIISETKYILMQKDVAKFLIKIKAPLISSVSPISGEIEIPIDRS